MKSGCFGAETSIDYALQDQGKKGSAAEKLPFNFSAALLSGRAG